MDKVTQQTAANAEESAAAAEELASQAEQLSAAVGELTLLVTGASHQDERSRTFGRSPRSTVATPGRAAASQQIPLDRPEALPSLSDLDQAA